MKQLSIFLLTLCVTGCVSFERPEDVLAVVAEEAVVFSSTDIPPEITGYLNRFELVILGEEHFVQEEHVFLAALTESLQAHGFRQLLLEGYHATGWMIQDYILGKRDDILVMDRQGADYLVETLRLFNAGLDDGEKVQVSHFDMNHFAPIFALSLKALREEIGEDELFLPILGSERPWADVDYLGKLEKLQENLSGNQDMYSDKWGALWFDRVSEIVAVEIRSFAIRAYRNDDDREELIIDILKKRVESGMGKMIISCGYYHGQKKNLFMPTPKYVLAEYFSAMYEPLKGAVFTGAFISFQGTRIVNRWEKTTRTFDIQHYAPENDLFLAARQVGNGKPVFLPLDNPYFSEGQLHLSYGEDFWEKKIVAPKLHFDGYFFFPEVTPLESIISDEFDF